jgi:hypothetical protein
MGRTPRQRTSSATATNDRREVGRLEDVPNVGPAVAADLRPVNPHVRCCSMSGSTGDYTAEELLALGAVHVLHKPFSSLSSLSQLLRETAGIGRP